MLRNVWRFRCGDYNDVDLPRITQDLVSHEVKAQDAYSVRVGTIQPHLSAQLINIPKLNWLTLSALSSLAAEQTRTCIVTHLDIEGVAYETRRVFLLGYVNKFSVTNHGVGTRINDRYGIGAGVGRGGILKNGHDSRIPVMCGSVLAIARCRQVP